MGSQSALVIGGTGPTGPLIVAGLAARGYEVTILHGGQHEVEFPGIAVEHIHEDAHFAESLERGLAGRTFDLVVAEYGRLRVTAEEVAGKTERLIAIGAAGAITQVRRDERWGPLGAPVVYPESISIPPLDASEDDRPPTLLDRMVQALDHVFEVADGGGFTACYLGYPNNYGPRQPGPQDWSVIRRALDARTQFVLADGGIRLETRVSTANAASAVLLAIDSPDVSAGKRYSVADQLTHTMRQRAEFIASYLGHQFDFVDMPFDYAWPCHPFYKFGREHSLCPSDAIREDLGYEDALSVEEGLSRMIEWLVANPPGRGGEVEQQINDPFDYEREDETIAAWLAAREKLGVPEPVGQRQHGYRHPKAEGEGWRPVADAVPTSPSQS